MKALKEEIAQLEQAIASGQTSIELFNDYVTYQRELALRLNPPKPQAEAFNLGLRSGVT